MVAAVEDSWSRIKERLSRTAPGLLDVLAAPATDDELAEVEAAHGVRLPSDLAQWWRGANGLRSGTLSSFATVVPPGLRPLGTRSAISDQRDGRQIGLDVAENLAYLGEPESYDYDDRVLEVTAEPAGTPDAIGSIVQSLSWFSFARDSDVLFADCRAGAMHGCVMQRFNSGGWSGPLWPSVAAMWEEAATIIESVDPGSWPVLVECSVGTWNFPRRGQKAY